VGLNRDPHYRRNDDWSSMTWDEYHALDPGRPLTDAPIGGVSSMKRQRDEIQSRAVSEVYHSPIPDSFEHGPRCNCARCEHSSWCETERARWRRRGATTGDAA
jgi:hypothetical protein